MAAKFRLNPEPTFKTKVGIPVPGVDKPVDVEFTFKYRDSDQMEEWFENKDLTPVQAVMSCVTGWELVDEFNEENVRIFCRNYPLGAVKICSVYAQHCSGAREKN